MNVYVDLDRTLFQTDRMKEVMEEIGKLYPEINPEEMYTNQTQFYVWSDDTTYAHDFSAQLISEGLDPDLVYGQLEQSDLADGRFEYDGAGEFIELLREKASPIILTYGFDDYQRFKAALCPSLQGIEIITMLQSKALFLEEINEPGWLVDDKAIGDELPSSTSFVQVSLDGDTSGISPDWPLLYSLRDAKTFFEDILSES